MTIDDTAVISRQGGDTHTGNGKKLGFSFEFFPPKSPEAAVNLWETVNELSRWNPGFVSVTYGAGGSTKEPTLEAVKRMISGHRLPTAAHLTCVDASRDDVHRVVEQFVESGVRHFVALRGDPASGIGTAYKPHPEGYANAAELVRGLREIGDFEISVSAYPEKHPESPDEAADIEMLKRKADNGANRALTQFFFDNDIFERYLDRVHAAGITIPVIPGIMPIQNLNQLKNFSARCGTSVPAFLDDMFAGTENDPVARAQVAVEAAVRQIEDLRARGIDEVHIYTMNRSPLVNAILEQVVGTKVFA